MIKFKNDGLITDNIITNKYECIELIKINAKIKPPNFDYINIRNIQCKNKIKKLYLFTTRIDTNTKYSYDIYKDFETEKIFNIYENYPHKYNYIDIDVDIEDEIYYYNFCKSFIKLDLNDYDFFTDFSIQPMIIELPTTPP